ncbi:MAG TPA: hypothetical protein IAB31_03480 [Candidatus Choladousia intestinavium]|uniref:Uncharacterized protein n=1 Tax=Candidatus Choladousia intestinavium TaxID=2840727 RepID=A0A9D1AB28_9FIRM|nr:hypothetical protein [Candidatus Choladousia intestinavium]
MDLWKKYYYISVRAEIVLALAGLLLFLVFPSRMNRTLLSRRIQGKAGSATISREG